MPVNIDDNVIQRDFSNVIHTIDNYVNANFTLSRKAKKQYKKVLMDVKRFMFEKMHILGTIKQNRSKLHLIHGILTMFLGGSWVGIATLLSFCVENDIFHVVQRLMLNVTQADAKKTSKSLHQLWLLGMVYYSVFSFPLLSTVVVAFMLEKYLSETIYTPAIMTSVEEQVPVQETLGIWCPYVVQGVVRFILVILSLFSFRIQVCLVMACFGFDKVYSSFSDGLRRQIEATEGPFKLNGKAVMLWVCAIACSYWQFLHNYESSFIGILVPLGFLVID